MGWLLVLMVTVFGTGGVPRRVPSNVGFLLGAMGVCCVEFNADSLM